MATSWHARNAAIPRVSHTNIAEIRAAVCDVALLNRWQRDCNHLCDPPPPGPPPVYLATPPPTTTWQPSGVRTPAPSPENCVGGCPDSCACAQNSFCCNDWSSLCDKCESGEGDEANGCAEGACPYVECQCLVSASGDGTCPATPPAQLAGYNGIEEFYQDEAGTRRPSVMAPGTCCQWSSTHHIGEGSLSWWADHNCTGNHGKMHILS